MEKIRTILVDDMPKARRMLRRMLEKDEEVEIVAEMGTAVEAVAYLQDHKVDMVFMDIEMPGMTGMEGTQLIGQMENPPLVVFVTAYSDYMVDAWKTDAIYYIVKPFELEEVQEAIHKYKSTHQKFHRYSQNIENTGEVKSEGIHKIQIMCFPIFVVKVDGETVDFKSKRSKELMAYLIHNKGGWVDNADLCAHILEDMDVDKAKNNLRTYIRRLKLTLDELGVYDVIEQSYGKIRIKTDEIDCDYYKYLAGDTQLFKGEYLREYSWAEPAVAMMYNKTIRKK